MNTRWKPYLELAYLLRGHSIEGIFEVHITVMNESLEKQEYFKKLCSEHGCKALMIELPSGKYSTQLMTSSYHRGHLKDVQIQAYELSQVFLKAGFVISRTKIEALISNSGVPQTKEEASTLSSENYFEFHIKIALPHHDNLMILNQICKATDAHLSKNSFKKIDEQASERFVTQRMYNIGKIEALERFNKCLEALKQSGYSILSTQREYAVYDSNIYIDKGWIDKQTNSDKTNNPHLINRERLFLISS